MNGLTSNDVGNNMIKDNPEFLKAMRPEVDLLQDSFEYSFFFGGKINSKTEKDNP